MRRATLPRTLALAALVLCLAVALLGCSGSATSTAAEHKATCIAHMKELKAAIDLVYADSNVYPELSAAQKQLPDATCPDGGTYTFDPNTDTISCSIHGQAPSGQ